MKNQYNFKDLASWPKVELHVHLDTSLSFETVSILSPGISKAKYLKSFTVPNKCKNLNDFLKYVEPSISLLQSKEALRLALLNLTKEQAADGVVYAEIRLAPLLHTRKGLKPHEVAEAVCVAAQEAEEIHGLRVRLIFCCMRHFSEEESLMTAALASAFKSKGVVGFDLAGDEAVFPLDAHVKAFQIMKQEGIPCTAHAGEALGAQSVVNTLDLLSVNRIGHGVRSIESTALINRLIEEKIHLEICPLSNIYIDVFESMKQHSLHKIYTKGVSISINTDGWGLFQNSLSREYHSLITHFEWSKKDFMLSNTMAIAASFCDQATKKNISELIETSYQIAS